MFVTLRGEPYLLRRAIDEHGAELEVLVQKRRDKSAAKRFFRRVLRSDPVPRKIRYRPTAQLSGAGLVLLEYWPVLAIARVGNVNRKHIRPPVYLPYVPNRAERLHLSGRTILAGQHEDLATQLPPHSRLL
jgi:hypothetical protein